MWINAIENKPQIDTVDKWNEENKISECVLVWIEGDTMPTLGRYYHKSNHWNLSGHLGFDKTKIKYFMYIDNPYS